MELQSVDIPQADSIWFVVRVLDAVYEDRVSARDIGAYLGDKVGRQGSYYVHAARILGLVTLDPQRHTVALTPYGRALRTYDPVARERALRHLVVRTEPMRAVVHEMVRRGGLDEGAISLVLQRLAPLSASTAERRVRTVLAWLRDLKLIDGDGDGNWHYCGPKLLAPSASSAEVQAALAS
jgi:hypothetical protein